MLSSFLTNFRCESEAGCLLHAMNSFLKASNSGGRGGGGALGPPLGPWREGRRKGGAPVGARMAWGEQLCLTIVFTPEDDEYIAHLSNNY
jgi:hypothetical protein